MYGMFCSFVCFVGWVGFFHLFVASVLDAHTTLKPHPAQTTPTHANPSQSSLSTRSYIMDHNICYLTLADKGYPKRLAFSYLEEVKDGFRRELWQDYGEE